jgi:hypothetical protein
MSPIGERLMAHWLAQGIEPPPGVPEEWLWDFEDRFSVTLPADMRSYFLHVDGMGSRYESDHNFFSFWPLGEVLRAGEYYEDRFVEEQSSYFLFADHSICLPAYAIRLTPSGTGPHRIVAI